MHNITDIDKQEGIEDAWHHLTVIRPDFSMDNNWLREWDIEPRKAYIKKGDGEKNVLTRIDRARGYQCDGCADRAEGIGY
jgi:hypothetical protein